MDYKFLQRIFGRRYFSNHKPEPGSHLDIALLEIVCVENAICKQYGITRSDLCKVEPSSEGPDESNGKAIRTVRQVAVPMDIPDHLKIGDTDRFQFQVFRPAYHDHSMTFHQSGGYYSCFLTEQELRFESESVRLWRWVGVRHEYPTASHLMFVEKKNLKKYYRLMLKAKRSRSSVIVKPILPQRMLDEIYNNSVGFIENYRDNAEKYKKYEIPYKRGLLLCGSPGQGKTMTCKWIKGLCEQKNIKYRIVTMQDYLKASSKGRTSELFAASSKQPVIVFFDDLDLIAKDRNKSPSSDLLVFLAELDGIAPKEGAVYIFTTNQMEELDSAFVRPGRIDLFLTFRFPTPDLRRRFITQRYAPEILQLIDVEDIVTRTHEYSFAEIEEIRKLLMFKFISNEPVVVEEAFKLFTAHRTEFKERALMGFGALKEERDEPDFYSDPLGEYD